MYLKLMEQYQLEIIAGLAILLLLILYIILKKRTKKSEVLLEIQPVVEDEYERKNEQSVEEESVEKEEKIDDIQTSEDVVCDFKKREVPAHEKIKKDDFNEFSGMRIILAEDNVINQKVILGLLGDSGIEIVVANDGQEVLNILEDDDNFALILMDAHMPNIDGFKATRIIRKNPKYNHIVVIALSGDTASDDIKKMKNSGMSETLEKPLKMDSLYDVLYAYNVDLPEKQNNTQDYDSKTVLDTEVGISICGGDVDFYKDILKEFLQNYGKSDETLLSFVEEDRVEDADKLLLDIMGICANLGAKQLNDTALSLKTMLKEPKENLLDGVLSYKDSLKRTISLINKFNG